MNITYDPRKRDHTLHERGLDFAHAAQVFSGKHFTALDDRKDYGEARQITAGYLDGRMVIVGWVQRGSDRHVFTMRKANEREIQKFEHRLE